MPRRQDGDPTLQVARLYDEYGAALYRYALILLADAGAAEDAVQQVFSALLQPGRAPLEQPDHYLRRAVRNECYSILRRRTVDQERAGFGSPPASSTPLLEPLDPAAAPVEERLALEAGLRSLPPEQRDVIYLHVYEGRTFREIAEASDESINTIASRYRYALSRLKAWLDVSPRAAGSRKCRTADDARS